MSKASELEAARLAAERTGNRCEAIIQELAAARTDPTLLVEDFARLMLAEATFISEQRKSGWKSRSDAHTAAGRILGQWAKDLAAHLERDKPPTRPPLETIKSPDKHADLDPADGPISAQITSGLLSQASAPNDMTPTETALASNPELIERIERVLDDPSQLVSRERPTRWPDGAITLDAAFGPLADDLRAKINALPSASMTLDATYDDAPAGETLVTITGQIEPDSVRVTREPLTHITAAPANYAWCDATSGLRGYVGTATCPDCCEAFDNYQVNGVAVKDLPPARIEPTLEPIDDHLTRHDDGRTTGVAKYAIQPDAPTVVRINIHGHAFMTDLPMSGRSGVLSVNYRAYEGGQVEILDAPDFQPDPPSQLEIIAASRVPDVPQFSEPGAPPPRQTQQRMTFEAVREHGMARARGADHRSYSQVQAFSECGIRYALSDLDATPAWWNVGGTALHYAVQAVNEQAAEPPWLDHQIEVLWTNCLNRSVSETITAHPTVGPDQWRAAKKGTEGYDWWRVHGLDMVRRWITRLTWFYDQGWTIATVDGKPAIELDCPMWIDRGALDAFGNPSLIKVENILDLVMVRDDTFLIVDAKSGANDPTSTYQLGQYGHALMRHLRDLSRDWTFREARILGAYWLARTDELRQAGNPAIPALGGSPLDIDLRELHPWSEIEYLITTMHAAESQGLYLPNKSKSDRFGCGSCGVSGLCPVGPR